MVDQDILFEVIVGKTGDIGMITLNRPNYLNALNQRMCIQMLEKLNEWEDTATIKAVVIRGAGDRAFCAGGDIRSIYEHRDQPEVGRQFFNHEYSINHRIFHYPKPYIALLNGITMGGGAGLSIPGKYRIATERLKFAMPETGIGFFTDVGGSYYLSRCHGKTGVYLGLTGAVINAADAFYAGLVNYQIHSEQLDNLLEQLTALSWTENLDQCVEGLLQNFQTTFAVSELQQQHENIEECFSKSSVEAILSCLDSKQEWGHAIAQQLALRCPLSLKVVFEQIQRGAKLNFDQCLQMEYRIANHFLYDFNFYEGVRAALIDKDKSPRWSPDSLMKVTEADVMKFFNALPDIEELEFEESSLEKI